MSDNLNRAIGLLKSGGFTCVLCDGHDVVTSTERGVKPLLDMIESGQDYSRYSAADKVTGKAAAYLYEKLGIMEVYTDVISSKALEVFRAYGCDITFGELVPLIRNRAGDGYCPMESAVLNIEDADEAYKAICDKRRQIMGRV